MVTVVMTTYDDGNGERFEYASRCWAAWIAHLESICTINLLAADDGSPIEMPNHWRTHWNIGTITGVHNGIGASLNRALAALPESEPWVYTTDDWLLTDYLDLDLPLWLLEQGYDLVRLGPLHPNLECKTLFTAGHGWWLDVDPHSPFAFATRPFLASPTLVEKIGSFDPGLNAYETERLYMERCHGRILVAATTLHGPWEHIGEYEVGDREVNQ
jgi:hypothetical protein